jgi:hypothetical protein
LTLLFLNLLITGFTLLRIGALTSHFVLILRRLDHLVGLR